VFEIFAWRGQLASAKRPGPHRAGFNYAYSGGQHSQVSCGSGCAKGGRDDGCGDGYGAAAAPARIMKAELTGGDNEPLETWNTETRTRLSPNSIHNDFAYNKFKASPYGIVAEMGATADIPLLPEPNVHPPGPPLRE
jgi:hypothetical protein